MLQGIPNQRILKDVGENFNPLSRISYTTNHDLYNIKKAFKIESDVIFDHDDTKSVSILIENLKQNSGLDNPILLYKPYGEEDNTIGKDNFFLIFMNTAQKEMLAKYGNNIIMIDSTHGTNPYKIQLTTLMVVDEDYEGFPVAFVWSITQTEAIYQTFFFCIREKLPELKPRIFISDDCNTFYNAFVKVYKYLPNKILCDWHVKKKSI
ncbi:hypothetical protein NQ317_003820 [Molorchus minor]|uniref:MULE transposase domain-containing protein n=1 Tax=Molorchus minor TaxID=1323400 RepID=A0ABQ9IPM8_9CUCU|nr:hypothetical protein NQ317_003820 [Molorchus minor]